MPRLESIYLMLILPIVALSAQPHFRYYFLEQRCFFPKGYFAIAKQTFCYSLILSRLISALIFLGSFVTRVPQIIKNIQEKSVVGLSFVGSLFECMLTAATAGYCINKKLAFSIYGENYFLFTQSLIILILFFIFKDKQASFPLFALSMVLCASFMLQWLPNYILNMGMTLNIFGVVIARGFQIAENWKNKSTGTLSLMSMMMIVLGNIGRALSILIQAPGQWFFLFGNCFVPLAINLGIIAQFYIYRSNDITSSAKKQ